MGSCELCGAKTNSLKQIKIGGSNMMVCNSCLPLGSEVSIKKESHTFRKKHKINVSKEEILENYNSLIQSALVKKNIDVHMLSRAVNIRESQMNKFLSKKIRPDIQTAKKIAAFLEINLVRDVEYNEDNYLNDEEEIYSNSLGDLIKNQLNKK
jgi:uncharacterized protein (TIGR00270 family)